MTTLRVRLPVPFDPSAPAAWWRVDDQGRIVERGTSSPPAWPAADRIEAVLGAGDVRIVSLELPPMNDARRASAAAFALEDHLAAPADTMHLAVTAPASVGAPTVVRIVDRAAVTWLAARRPAIDRVVAEPDLPPSDGTWRWCADADGRGFVRRSDGSAFAADASGSSELPAELAAALAHARRDAGAAGAPPARIVVDAPADAPRLAAWTQATGVTFVQGTPWSLERVPDASWRSAPDVRAGHSVLPSAAPASIARRFAPAVALALVALALHVVLTAAGWTHARHLYPVLVERRADVFARLHDRGVGVQVHHVPIHHHPAYAAGTTADDLPMTEAIYAHVLSLPLFVDLTVDEQDVVIDALAAVLG